eukprot:2674783-Amphidinium_carterae.1
MKILWTFACLAIETSHIPHFNGLSSCISSSAKVCQSEHSKTSCSFCSGGSLVCFSGAFPPVRSCRFAVMSDAPAHEKQPFHETVYTEPILIIDLLAAKAKALKHERRP